MRGRIVQPFLVLLHQRGYLAHHQFINPQVEVFLSEFASLVIELGSCLETNLLNVVFFRLLSLHPDFKDLAILLAQWLIGHRTVRRSHELNKERLSLSIYLLVLA